MKRQPSALENALADYLKTGNKIAISELCEDEYGYENPEVLHEMVEIAILPGYARSNLDEMWIQTMNNTRLDVSMYPDDNLQRFFKLMNVVPSQVFDKSDLGITVATPMLNISADYAKWVNKQNFDIIKKYFDMMTEFELDASRPALCDAETVRAIIDNTGYGGVPIIAGLARVSEILELDFTQEIQIAGEYQVGIWDTMNGSGHMESGTAAPFAMKLDRGDLFVLKTKGYTPDESCGFVRKYYRLELATQTTRANQDTLKLA